jgi:hypothetical protein
MVWSQRMTATDVWRGVVQASVSSSADAFSWYLP